MTTTSPAQLPAAGPQWYGSVMGTGILALLTSMHWSDAVAGPPFALFLLTVDWLLLIGLSVAFAGRVSRRPSIFLETLRQTPVLVTWGMVSMGVLSTGSATATVLASRWVEHAHAVWVTDTVLWTIGTAIGLATAFGFGAQIIGRDLGAPNLTWGLPIVPPMVSATTGTALVTHTGSLPAQVWMLMATVCCFFLALFLGLIVFATAYHHHWRIAPVPLAARPSSWIPIGMVGQSTAAAQSIASQAKQFLVPEAQTTVQHIADAYGYVMMTLAVPLILWAIVTTARGLMEKMPYTPGWWAMTFPVGTVSLGSLLLSRGSGLTFFHGVSVTAWAVLCGTWTLCAVGTVIALVRTRR
ncbi:TDT family transporter [Corynebacterium anserum]|uniref:C4-dicarboxylate ABC transporter n=1 Tax=Corynebacterium anserum TaxID=2684406 RepID=A0A7G7YN53_9CORY|nr:TDT family transporter [Corynebacterium anserum]MBC2680837.1 C4-dicarboxylate ABC transporter [Corynebacterium anserum]QNH95923.1 C4-dicarboxylate ABC transporter [Corynebacterium anserum]